MTTKMLVEQLGQLQEAVGFCAEDGVASWLPLYHDMGLIASYWMPLWYGAASAQIGAGDWILNPELLLNVIEKDSVSFCWLPNFAFAYLGQRREAMKGPHDLKSVRAWINCSEPVRRKSLEQFSGAFEKYGVRQESLQSSYAMAETVFAITQSTLGRELVQFPRSHVFAGKQAHSGLSYDLLDEVYLSSGKPLRGVELGNAAGGLECGEAVPGETCLHS